MAASHAGYDAPFRVPLCFREAAFLPLFLIAQILAHALGRQADHPVLVLCAVPGVPLATRAGNVLRASFRESQRPV